MLPPWPGWEGLHPLVIHFPIALLLVAPVFVAIAIVRGARGTCLAVSALILLVLGTAGAFVAAETGEAAADAVKRTEAISAALESHATLAETARDLFAGLTLVYGVLLALPVVVKRLARPSFAAVANAAFLVLLLGGDLVLATAAHRGGLLVHKFGVRAVVAPGRM